ncbi:septal ring lytic transglycosylase RlpA family protein [Methylocystis sp. 9N]|uniref:Endolytic peptidoglycan transglycosylase RlpA n=1 Tax=Methylocystis borbori TaxID=3118750 RepID=A0ABU7XER8_9HYPH
MKFAYLSIAGAAFLFTTDFALACSKGEASYYSLSGPTASGGRVEDFTAAHRTLPLGSLARVTNIKNGRTLILKINDRGPYAEGRIIDVSKNAAKALDFINEGVTQVLVEEISLNSKAC